MARTIGQAAALLGMSADTLRYYERIELLPPPVRTPGGKRIYREADLARLRFIQRAQAVGFSLEEIAKLLRFRENPVKSSRAVRALASRKHAAVLEQLRLLEQMETELALLISICRGDAASCPILDRLEGEPEDRSRQPHSRPA